MEKYKIKIIYGNDNLENIVENILIKSVKWACKNDGKLSLGEGGKKN